MQKEVANKKIIHGRYKDLALVEWTFRTIKTVELEIRPVLVRLAKRTREHAFVVMLAYNHIKLYKYIGTSALSIISIGK